MTLYLHSSHIVKLYIEEGDSEGVRQLAERADALATSVVAYPEVRSTFARRQREKLLTGADGRAAVRQFDIDWPKFIAIPVDDDQALAAGRIADKHGVRGFDAIHLAAFESLVSHADGEVQFSCADARLVRAARKLG